ncbi:MAG: glycosyltransferase [Lachnospiraceae bacterium]
MKVLIVNKFLYPNGGSETYIFEIGKQLQKMGHEVQYFGMEHEGNIVGNRVQSYTKDMDFHGGSFSKLLYPFKIIYSKDARRKIRAVLDDFAPDVVHLNNINFQITPSILYEVRAFERKSRKKINIIVTAHDYQWICPNHMLYIPEREEICNRCLNGKYMNCTKNKCIHNSKLKSLIGTFESIYYHKRKTYGIPDTIICPSEFLYRKFENDPVMKDKLIVLHNFVTDSQTDMDNQVFEKENYVLYFGRYSKEKGIRTLLNVCRQLPDITFVFAGSGPLEKELADISNIKNVGFKNGDELKELIGKARFSIYPSEWYENCPFSVIESQIYGTPVIGADIGGIPELIEDGKTGELFESGSEKQLKEKIEYLWNNRLLCEEYSKNCRLRKFDNVDDYVKKIVEIYEKK